MNGDSGPSGSSPAQKSVRTERHLHLWLLLLVVLLLLLLALMDRIFQSNVPKYKAGYGRYLFDTVRFGSSFSAGSRKSR